MNILALRPITVPIAHQDILPRGYSNGGMRLTTLLHLVLKIRLSGVIPTLSLAAYVMHARTKFYLIQTVCCTVIWKLNS